MIKNKEEYDIIITQIGGLFLPLSAPREYGMPKSMYNAIRARVKGLIDELQQEVTEYKERSK